MLDASFRETTPLLNELLQNVESTVGAVYDRAYFVDSRKNARS